METKWLRNAIETHTCDVHTSCRKILELCGVFSPKLITPKNTRVFYTPEIWRYNGKESLLFIFASCEPLIYLRSSYLCRQIGIQFFIKPAHACSDSESHWRQFYVLTTPILGRSRGSMISTFWSRSMCTNTHVDSPFETLCYKMIKSILTSPINSNKPWVFIDICIVPQCHIPLFYY